MSAEMVSSTDTVEIYVPLLNEGTDVLRPTRGLLLGADVVQVLATTDYDPAVEEWEFPPGSRVRCVSEFRGGRQLLIARNRLS
ncbi:MAG TPA: hypothetical protein DDY78_19095 [Planctomycetales bacterium]|jgi:hypothetical protein|nr:hypothetical protein [Planctomycetales bacterium]